MIILGYSERGAMNALFYGMAFDKQQGESSLKEFFKLAGISGDFSDFEIFNEFSLSEFGDPDLIIKAKNANAEGVLFFIEAKASCGKKFDLSNQIKYHDDYMNGGNKYEKGHASNLIFQLRLKSYFFKRLKDNNCEQKIPYPSEYKIQKRLEVKSDNVCRTIGKNIVVKKLVNEIKDCTQVYYIAIIPKTRSIAIDDRNKYGFEIHTISWETITEKFDMYVGETIRFNQDRNEKNKEISQILNN